MDVFYNREFAGTHLLLLGLVVLIAWVGTRARLAHVLLFSSLFFSHVGFDYRGLNIRLDYLVCALVLLPNLINIRELWRQRTGQYVALLLLCFALSSIWFAPAPSYSLRKLAIVVIYAVTAAIVLAPTSHRLDLGELVGTLLRVGNVVLLLSLIGFALFYAGVDLGFVKDRETAWLRGPMLNPNLFGSTAAVLGLLNLDTALRGERAGVVRWGALIISVACVFLSYTRAAWLLFAVCGAALVLWRFFKARRIRFAHVLAITLGGLVMAFLPRLAIALGFEEKLGGLFQFETGTGLVRVVMLQEGLSDWLHSPIFGNGFQSFERLLGADQDPTIVQQMILTLQVLQYGGLVALLLFAGLVLRVHRDAWRAIRADRTGTDARPVGAMLLGFDLLLAAYQATSGLLLAFFWFYLFLLVHLARQRLPQARDVTAAASPAVV